MSRSEQVELKPCPFCGGNVTLTTGGKSDGLLTFVCDEGSTCRGSKIFTGTLVEDRETAITAWNTRAPSALPVGWSDETLEAMCRAHDAEESAQMGEPSLWAIHDRGDADGTDWSGTEEGWETYRTDRIAAMRAAVAMLSASPPSTLQKVQIAPPEPVSGWRDIATAPRDGSMFFAVVDGDVRLVSWGKTSHVPIYGFCLADQGAEDYDLCEPSCWQPLPSPPSEPGVK